MNRTLSTILAGAFLVFGLSQQAHSGLITEVVFKLSDSTADANKLDAYTGWTTSGGFNESNATAKMLVDNGLDYKSSLVDSWPVADMTNVRVSMYSRGNEVAFLDFNPAGTTNSNFFAPGNVTSSSWLGLPTTSSSFNYFSIPGHDDIDRHWFINVNYGGCPSDTGYMVVLDSDGSQPCAWETSQLTGNNRAFLYAGNPVTATNWNTNVPGDTVAVADVFAVSITRNVPDQNGDVPAPATVALFGLGLLGLAGRRRRQAGAA